MTQQYSSGLAVSNVDRTVTDAALGVTDACYTPRRSLPRSPTSRLNTGTAATS